MNNDKCDEDYRKELCEQADFFGMESLTEDEQQTLESNPTSTTEQAK